MGISFGSSKAITEGLILKYDPKNSRSNLRLSRNQNILSQIYRWEASSGSVPFWTHIGQVYENVRLFNTDPWGHDALIWQAANNDIASDADGGWNSGSFAVDTSKLYRFSTFVRRNIQGDGHFYLGTNQYSSASACGLLNRVSNTFNNNPYFVSDARGSILSTNIGLGNWCLVVGHIWPIGSGAGANHSNTGMYKMDGTKVTSISDFIWQDYPVPTSIHRTYLYYNTDPTTVQEWASPRVDLCDGKEPSIAELLSNFQDTMINLVNTSTNKGTVKNQIPLTSSNNFSLTLTGGRIILPNDIGYTNKVSVFAWVKALSSGFNGFNIICGGQELELSILNTGELRAGILTDTQRWWSNSGSGLADGKWHQIGFTYQPDVKYMYVDGELIDSQNTTGNLVYSFNNRNLLRFGTDNRYGLYGELGTYEVWNRVLNSNEVRYMFYTTKNRYNL